MIDFFKNVLDGPLYIVTTILCIIFIMAIIGFLMERKKLEKEQRDKIAVVEKPKEVVPITPVTIQEEKEIPPVSVANVTLDNNPSIEVKPTVVALDNENQRVE